MVAHALLDLLVLSTHLQGVLPRERLLQQGHHVIGGSRCSLNNTMPFAQ